MESTSADNTDPRAVPQQPSLAVTFLLPVTIIGALFLFVFHLGAAMLSYRKFGSAGWAIIDFFFAELYYPYYALFLDAAPAAVPAAVLGGRRRHK